MLLGEPSPWVVHHFSKKFNDFDHWECYKIPKNCLSTTQLHKLSDGAVAVLPRAV
jgi:hypothetical protein